MSHRIEVPWEVGGMRPADASLYWRCLDCREWFRSTSRWAARQDVERHERGELSGMPLEGEG